MEYRIERLMPGEFNQLIPLMQNCFGMNTDINYFQWKFLQNPVGEFIGFTARDDQNNVVAFEGLIPIKYSFEGKGKIIYHSVDTMTHSEHRRKGLYQKLAFKGYEYLREREQLFVYGFGGKMSTPALLKFGWKELFNIPFYFRSKHQIKLKEFFSSLKSDIFSIKETDHNEEILPVIQSKPDINGVCLIKDITFLRWRLSNPRINYKIAGIYSRENVILGYLIYYIENNKIMLFDADLIDSSNQTEKILFNWLDQLLINNNYKGIVTFSQENTRYSRYLVRNGFIKNSFGFGPLSEKLPFMIYSDHDTVNLYDNKELWSIRPFDHDSF
jgi:hypothetical protein